MAILLPNGKQQYFDPATGEFLVGGKLWTYAANTSLGTPKVTYTNAAETAQNTNPIILNAEGAAVIFWDGAYDAVLTDADDNVINTFYDISSLSDAADVDYGGATLSSILLNHLVYSVATISALRAVDKTKNKYAFVAGYYAAGDGGGGLYWYDSGDTTTADNGGTVIVATDSGRWKLETFGQPVSVAQFGAKNDGITDSTAYFQDAADWLGSNTGASLLVLGSYYLASSPTWYGGTVKGFAQKTDLVPADCPSVIILGSSAMLDGYSVTNFEGLMVISQPLSPDGANPIPFADAAAEVAGVAAYVGQAFQAALNVKNCSVLGFDDAGDAFYVEDVVVDCTNGFTLRKGASRLYTGYSLCSTTITRTGYPFSISAMTNSTRALLYQCTFINYLTTGSNNGDAIFDGCTVINTTADAITNQANCHISLRDCLFASHNYALRNKTGTTYIVDGCENASIYLESGASYGSVTNSSGATVSGDATALLKCNISDNIQASTPSTFTPVLKFGGASTGITYTEALGSYTLQGNVVTGTVGIVLSSKGSATGAATITGLPYTSSAVTASIGGGAATLYLNMSGINAIAGVIYPSASEIDLFDMDSGTDAAVLADTNFANNSTLRMTFSYFIDR